MQDSGKTNMGDDAMAIYIPAPVTRATLPSNEAAAGPNGPGIASYAFEHSMRPIILCVGWRLNSRLIESEELFKTNREV